MARIDDVTIEIVNLSKEELDMSLFEYEQLKNTKPNLTSKLYGSATTNKENKHSKLELTNSVTLNKLIQKNLCIKFNSILNNLFYIFNESLFVNRKYQTNFVI